MQPIHTHSSTESGDSRSLQLAALATQLDHHHQTIMQAWRRAVDADERLQAASHLSRREFEDNIPASLRLLSGRLRRELGAATVPAPADEGGWATEEEGLHASEHGLHRWQEGYDISELMWEWSHLHLCLLEFFERVEKEQPAPNLEAIARGRFLLAELINSGFSQSVTAYHQLQQAEAKEIVRDLTQSLGELETWNRQRGELLHQTVHDLRGNMFPVTSAADLLESIGGTPSDDELRRRVMQLLQSSTRSHMQMLNDLLDLARLEAGQEVLQLSTLSVDRFLAQLAASMVPLAQSKGLQLVWDGTPDLEVLTDEIKLQRIVQNLMLNALKYTNQGSVHLAWGATEHGQWYVEVRDTGPGIAIAPSRHSASSQQPPAAANLAQNPIAQSLEAASSEPGGEEEKPTSSPQTAAVPQEVRGEGVGLVIVKRLCTLLHAKLEVHSSPQGAVFRVAMPQQYD